MFPDNYVGNNPYKILFGEDDYPCSVAEFTGTMKGPMKGADGKAIKPTNKKFKFEFCTVAHWKNGEILEERLFYDVVGMMKQLGLM
jgi:ketosteroid isomerase-like protein